MYCTPCNGTLKLFFVYHNLERKLFFKINLRIMNSFVGPSLLAKNRYVYRTCTSGHYYYSLFGSHTVYYYENFLGVVVASCSNHNELIVPATSVAKAV